MPEESALTIVDRIIRQGASVGVAVVDELRRKIKMLARRGYDRPDLMRRIRQLLVRHEPILSRTLTDAILASWLSGGRQAVRYLPEPDKPTYRGLPPPDEPPFTGASAAGDPEPIVRFPIIEGAAADLRDRQVYTRADLDVLADEAKRSAFTVARVQSLDALERIQDAITEDITEGRTLRQFADRVDEILGEGALSPPHVENIYRTNVAKAYSRGLIETLGNPMVSDEFPYLEYSAVHDTRTQAEHRAMEELGLDGGPIYRRDDPVWKKFLPPWRWNCRCAVIPLTIEDAARKGVSEAKRWLETGMPPTYPEFVPSPPFDPPDGFVTAGRMPAIV